MIETFGKSQATKKMKYTEYLYVIVFAWMKKLVQVFQRNYNVVLWRKTRRPMQMLARARHSSPLIKNTRPTQYQTNRPMYRFTLKLQSWANILEM